MKHFLFICSQLILLLPANFCSAQIDSALGIHTIDSCFDEKNCWNIQLDSSAGNIWQIGNTTKPFFGALIHPPNGIMTDTINSYPVNNHSYFYLRVPFYGNSILGFWHKYQMDTLSEVGYIDYSVDTGATWYNVIDLTGFDGISEFNVENMYSQNDVTALGIPGFTGTHNDWIFTRIQWIICIPVLAPFTCEDTLLLRFHFISDSVNTNKDGWIIDGIQTFLVDLGSGIDEINGAKNNLLISPNPSHDKISIAQFSANNHVLERVDIFDELGRKMITAPGTGHTQMEIDVHTLSPGVYFLRAKDSGGEIFNGKLLKE
jgi:hypothetical protein